MKRQTAALLLLSASTALAGRPPPGPAAPATAPTAAPRPAPGPSRPGTTPMPVLAAPVRPATTPAAAPAKGPARQVKATFACMKITADQKPWKIGTEGYKIDTARIDCTAKSKDSRLVGGTAIIQTTWHIGGAEKRGRERHGEPIAEGGDYEYIVTLDKDLDYEPCSEDLTIPLTVSDVNGQVVFSAQETYRQNCPKIPVAPPVGTVKPVGDSATWEAGALEKIPQAARVLAQQFIEAAVDVDPPTLATLAAGGVKKGNKVLRGKDVYDLGPATGIKATKACNDAQTECHWGDWSVIPKGASEFWLYSTNDSGYGSFACAVFTKAGGTWKWSAVKLYETGEP